MFTRVNRTSADYILAWNVNGPGKSLIQQLKNDPNADINEIRLVVTKGDMSLSRSLAPTLGKRGNPAKDFSVLLDVLKKARASSGNSEIIEGALRTLTGLNLPPETSIDDWTNEFKVVMN